MDSSPPLMAQQDGPTDPGSRDITTYSLDLNALTQNSTDYPSSSPMPIRKIDQVRSEDIDGPSDFTLNMEDWMRGTHKSGKKGTRNTLGRGGTLPRGTVRSMFVQEPDAQIEEVSDEEERGKAASPVDGGNQEYDKHDDTPIAGFYDSSLQERDGARSGTATPRVSKENDLSLWDAHLSNSSSGNDNQADRERAPKPDQRNGFLQPTVEDYYSELSPGRPSSAPPLPSHLFRPDERGQVGVQAADAPTPPPHRPQQGRPAGQLWQELESMRSARDQAELRSQHLDDQLRASNEARQSLQRQLDASTAALSAANATTSRINDKEETDASRTADLEVALSEEQAKSAALQRSLSKSESDREELRMQLEEMRESEDEELHTLRRQIKTSDTARQDAEGKLQQGASELTRVRAELEMLRREKDTTASTSQSDSAAREVDILKSQLEEAKKQNEQLRHRLKAAEGPQSQSGAHAAGTELYDAREEIANLRDELDLLQNLSRLDNDAEEDKIVALDKAELDKLRAELKIVSERAERAASLAEERAGQIKGLNEAIASLRDARASARNTSREERAGEREELQGELRESERKRLDLHSRLDEMRAELDGLRTANAEMDQRVADTLRKREEEWRRREGEWEKERKVMAKALMWGWGKEECGVDMGREQRYRYRYPVRKVVA